MGKLDLNFSFNISRFDASITPAGALRRWTIAGCAAVFSLAGASSTAFAQSFTTTINGITATCTPNSSGVTSCTYSGGVLNGFTSTSSSSSITATNGSCTISVPISNGVVQTSSITTTSGCSGAQAAAFGGIATGGSSNFGSGSAAILTQSLGLVAQDTARVGVGVVHSVTTNIRDSLQGRQNSSPVAMRYTWNPDDDEPLSYGAKSPVTRAPVFKAMPKAPIMRTVTYALWGQGFGDIEWRSGSVGGVDLGRTTSTVGGIGGADVTITNIFSATDAYVIGVLGGYTAARVRNNDGSSARVEGPGVGFYTIYVNGGFSTDSTFKVDFFDLNRSAALVPDLGLHLTSYSSAYNVNYKFEMMPWWWEPTVGVSYTSIVWDGASRAMGFEDGHTWRLQGGVRVGTTWDWNGVKVEPTLTGMAYSDVQIHGGTVAQAAGGLVVPTDEGKVFGQGIGKLNFIWANNLSSYIEGEVRGRDGVLGAAGRLGLRYAFMPN